MAPEKTLAPNPSDAEEHRSAGRMAQYVAGAAIVSLAVAVFAVLQGFMAVFWTGLGLFVALLVVAAMLYFDSEHQSHRSGPPAGTTRR